MTSIASNLPLGEDPIEQLGPDPGPDRARADLARVTAALPSLVRSARLAAAIRTPIDIVDVCAVVVAARTALKRAGLS